jgi:hypothetical protein
MKFNKIVQIYFGGFRRLPGEAGIRIYRLKFIILGAPGNHGCQDSGDQPIIPG